MSIEELTPEQIGLIAAKGMIDDLNDSGYLEDRAKSSGLLGDASVAAERLSLKARVYASTIAVLAAEITKCLP